MAAFVPSSVLMNCRVEAPAKLRVQAIVAAQDGDCEQLSPSQIG